MTTTIAKNGQNRDGYAGTLIEGLHLPTLYSDEAGLIANARVITRIVQLLHEPRIAKQFAMATITELNKLTDKCTTPSVLAAVCNCATLGLIPGRAYGHAFYVPKAPKAGRQKELNCWLGYKGFLELAYRSDFLRDCYAEVVLEGEKFRRYVTADGPQIEHELPIDRVEEWDRVQAAYCVYHTRSGGSGMAVVGFRELDALKRKQGNVWNQFDIEMAKKTAVRRASKMWQKTKHIGFATMIDEQAESDESQTHESVPAGLVDVARVGDEGLTLGGLDDDPASENPAFVSQKRAAESVRSDVEHAQVITETELLIHDGAITTQEGKVVFDILDAKLAELEG